MFIYLYTYKLIYTVNFKANAISLCYFAWSLHSKCIHVAQLHCFFVYLG